MNIISNLILNTDSYKVSHFRQYPPGTEYVSSYIESRPRDGLSQDVVFFGLQMFIQKYLTERFTIHDIADAAEICKAHGVPFNYDGWIHILDVHDGYLPIKIDALPEGMVVPAGTPMVQVRNTDPAVPWLTSYVETALLRAVWYPSTVATVSREAKKTIKHYLEMSSDDPAGQIPFKLHDFGARGCTSLEQAGIGGAAHLVNFMGTDTLSGIIYAREYYGAEMAGFSIPASEHSTITAWGVDGEEEAYSNMLEQFPTGLVACVSDSYDLFNAVQSIWGDKLKDKVLVRDGTLVVRPDSGDPVEMVLFCLTALGEAFGVELNSKGFKVLNPKVRVIQGDGIDSKMIDTILMEMIKQGWSADNIAFGMGAGLLQHVNRDTYRFAMKASAICINGDWRPVFKDPKTDPGKASKKGIQHVIPNGEGGSTVVSTLKPEVVWFDKLQPVYMKDMDMSVPTLHSTMFYLVRERAEV